MNPTQATNVNYARAVSAEVGGQLKNDTTFTQGILNQLDHLNGMMLSSAELLFAHSEKLNGPHERHGSINAPQPNSYQSICEAIICKLERQQWLADDIQQTLNILSRFV